MSNHNDHNDCAMHQDAWDWIDGASGRADRTDGSALETARQFARVFSHPDGAHIIEYLRKSTRERIFGPEVSEATLRYVEGQRALVACMESMIERGRVCALRTGK